MEKDKYYTPEIEEFHVGFEYESEWGAPDHPRAEWHDEVFSKADSIENLCERVRVKYLDQEDIESLGFKLVEEEEGLPPLYCNKISEEHSWLLMTQEYDGGTELEVWIASRGFNIKKGRFEGDIKNKSELKQVLKMIGYEE
jgi:hypothetical protein